MELPQAIKRAYRWKFTAIFIFLVAGTTFILAVLKSLYFIASLDILPNLMNNWIGQVVWLVYSHIPGLPVAWRWLPTLNVQHFNTPGNYGFAFILCCLFIARLIWDAAHSLSKRIKDAIKRAEEIGWTEKAMGLANARQPDGAKIFPVHVAPDSRDKWYKRPVGVIVMGVAVAVLGQWINLLLGLSSG